MDKINQSSTSTVNTVDHGQPASTQPGPSQGGPPPILPAVQDVAFSGDPGAMMAALTVESGKAQRDVARKLRDHAMEAQEKAESAEVQDIHDKADLQRFQGIVGGGLQVLQGVSDCAAGVNEARAATDEGRALKSDRQRAAGFKAGSTGFAASKTVSDGFFNGWITDKDASAKAHDVSAQAFKQIAEDAHDAEKDGSSLIDKTLEFLKEYVDTRNQTAMAAIHRA